MKAYDLEQEDIAFGDPSIHVLNDALRELDRFDAPEPDAPSLDDLVEQFIEYRKRVGRRKSQ